MKKSTSRKIFEVCNVILMCLTVAVTLYPIFNRIAVSFSDNVGLLTGRVNLWPRGFTLETYKLLLEDRDFWNGYKNTIVYTVVGTVIGLCMTTMCSYALSKPYLAGRSVMLKLIVFTMFFGAGIIPYYNLIKTYKMLDSMWALVIPPAIAPYNVMLMRTYFSGLPRELEDAASIDGAGQFTYFIKVVLPLSKPIISTITLFISVGFWNDWFSALIYLTDGDKYPVTLYLRNLLMGLAMMAQEGNLDSSTVKILPTSAQAASMLLVILPVLVVYPFVQKHFVKGVMIGSIKG